MLPQECHGRKFGMATSSKLSPVACFRFAWAVRIIGFGLPLMVPYVMARVYFGMPMTAPPTGVSPEFFRVVVAAGMFLAAVVGFKMFFDIYRQDILPFARKVESGEVF
jgi:hypothetical protein